MGSDSLMIGAMNQPEALSWFAVGIVVGVFVTFLSYWITVGVGRVAAAERRAMGPPKPPGMIESDYAALDYADLLAKITARRITGVMIEAMRGQEEYRGRYRYVLALGRVEVLALQILHLNGGELAEPVKLDNYGQLVSFLDADVEFDNRDSYIGVMMKPRMELVGD